MISHIAVLGRQPKIGLAELISLYGSGAQQLSPHTALVKAEQVDFPRLGGAIKLASLIEIIDSAKLSEVMRRLPGIISNLAGDPRGKLTLGFSLYDGRTDPKELFRASLELKKQLRQAGYSVRLVNNQSMALNAAQVIHNRLIDRGMEIVLVSHQGKTYLAVTEQVQNIDAYSKRDYERPARSAKIGMLPPKLAQIMINLANPAIEGTILDPFCGTGVIAQEAILMGFKATCSDLDAACTKMTKINLDWLDTQYSNLCVQDKVKIESDVTDARSHQWSHPIDAVVTEGYLGPALSEPPSPAELRTISDDARKLTLAFLRNLRSQITPGTPVSMTIPAWRLAYKFHKLDIIDQITALGYTLKQFSPVEQTDLLYSRNDQIVGRELLVLTRI